MTNWRSSPACSPEQRLIALLCGTQAHREARYDEATELAAAVNEQRLLNTLSQLQLLGIIGERLSSLPVGLSGGAREKIKTGTCWLRRRGTAMELTALSVLAKLERAGIRALPLKGSTLARALYGDPAMRISGDVDILVAPEDLDGATDVVCQMGWTRDIHPLQGNALPLLHERLFHPRLPTVEIHWRIHWLETRFAADALARATRHSGEGVLRMQRPDELASLMLFYSRDGFTGLRTPADIAQWWTVESAHSSDPRFLDAVADSYPELTTAIELSASLLEDLVGVPAPITARDARRRRLVRKMVNPFSVGPPNQLAANAALVDVLLARSGEKTQALGRHLLMPSLDEYRRFARLGASGKLLAQAEHMLRVTRRWALGVASAYARGDGLWGSF